MRKRTRQPMSWTRPLWATRLAAGRATYDDPEAYVASWTDKRTYRYRADLKLQEFVCEENNRNVDPTSGVTRFK